MPVMEWTQVVGPLVGGVVGIGVKALWDLWAERRRTSREDDQRFSMERQKALNEFDLSLSRADDALSGLKVARAAVGAAAHKLSVELKQVRENVQALRKGEDPRAIQDAMQRVAALQSSVVTAGEKHQAQSATVVSALTALKESSFPVERLCRANVREATEKLVLHLVDTHNALLSGESQAPDGEQLSSLRLAYSDAVRRELGIREDKGST